MQSKHAPNRLINEKSPYLQQHAYNPVDWYAWGDDAFARARAEEKPIFLSVGYSTCHWCHVMERECFENESIASLMNELCVNVKVDREERPDVDKVYMTALQAMGENGGWPMSMFLTPDLRPFYGGTYFPPENRYGRIGFPELLQRVSEVWKNERSKVLESANGITEFLKEIPAKAGSGASPDASLLATCFNQAARSYDEQFGGFGSGPKFPRPVVFDFLLRYHQRTGDTKALEMTEKSLRAMSNGGMVDHIGGGYHRYSVDGEWRVPHFEKMLYDQALIVCSLADTYRITGDPFYKSRIVETLDYVLRDLTDSNGGCYSAEDADSQLPGESIHDAVRRTGNLRPESPDEKVEGAFYTWTKKEIERVLGEDAKAFCFRYGIEESGNALSDPQHEFVGKNILYCAETIESTALFLGTQAEEANARLHRAKELLFAIRAKRPRPHLDDKIITAWNGLMISAFTRGAQALGSPEYLHAAERAATFIVQHLYSSATNTLLRRYREGEAKLEAHLDDYAFFTQGLIDLYETSFDWRWLQIALRLTGKMIELFWDETNGGFFDTSGKDASILVRMKDQHDGAEPTGNSVAVMNLLRLASMTDNHEWRKKADRTFSAFGETLQKSPFAMPQMAAAYDFSIRKVKQIVIAGRRPPFAMSPPDGGVDHGGMRDDESTKHMMREVHSRYLSGRILLLADGSEEQREVFGENSYLNMLTMIDGKPTAYVCEDFACRLPTTEIDKLRTTLDRRDG